MSAVTSCGDPVNELEDSDQFVPFGAYQVAGTGSSNSKRVTIARSFIDYHGLDSEQSVRQYLDTETGCLILAPDSGVDR
jgi:hypothetical protein